MKILKTLFIILIILIIIRAGAGFGWLQYQKPQYKGEVDFTSLHEDVQVRFDEFGVPHIYATNKKDAFTALGYVHAQDRLFQMEMLRRVGAGRLSEILGKDFIETDKFFRTLGIDQHSKASVKEIYSKNRNELSQENQHSPEKSLVNQNLSQKSQEDIRQKIRPILNKVANHELTIQEAKKIIQEIKQQSKAKNDSQEFDIKNNSIFEIKCILFLNLFLIL